jgi:hypothetical protein
MIVWQRRFDDSPKWTKNKRVEKLRYMHRNPVKRTLVLEPEQWRWSSYRFYAYRERGAVLVNEALRAEMKPELRRRATYRLRVEEILCRQHRGPTLRKSRRVGQPQLLMVFTKGWASLPFIVGLGPGVRFKPVRYWTAHNFGDQNAEFRSTSAMEIFC